MSIYVNQTGYMSTFIKRCTAVNTTSYSLYNSENHLVKKGNVCTSFDKNSGDNAAEIDFSDVRDSGTYYFTDDSGNKSCSFSISDFPYENLLKDACRMFYFQRCGCELDVKYAGAYKHCACHTSPVTLLSNSARSFDCSGGWHDAGDYGKYITAGAVAVGHLLYAYELCPESFEMSLDIPESGNHIPDILNEVRYELEWFLKMQDEDGGVHHKCTSMYHTGFVMPEDDNLPFIVTDVSSLATGDFVAVMSAASRIYAKFDSEFSDKTRKAAEKSFEWLCKNPEFIFKNPPECTTGTYEDFCDVDERMWACAEYYRLTGDRRATDFINSALNMKINTTALGWGDVGGFASIAILTAPHSVFSDDLIQNISTKWIEEASRLCSVSSSNSYGIAFHTFDFGWGSNMTVLTNAMILSFAHKLTGESRFLDAAIQQTDYILGRNAMNISYVTGYGENAFRNPHNRPTYADNIDDPIPGYVSGGPNRNPCDPDACALIPEGSAPMKCYADVWGSYSTNEITIYWNSPLVFVLAYLKSL